MPTAPTKQRPREIDIRITATDEGVLAPVSLHELCPIDTIRQAREADRLLRWRDEFRSIRAPLFVATVRMSLHEQIAMLPYRRRLKESIA
jgi:hypothetical protein